MHTRDISVGGRTHLHRNRPPRQAGRRRRRSSARATPWSSSPPARGPNPREGIDFLPLTVDYRENTYASGRIPGGFFKREGKPPEKEVLTSRLIDRPIRPLFPDGWRNETQIIALVISADTDNDSRRARDHRRLGGAGAVEHPVQTRTHRRRPRRPRRRRLHRQPDLRAAASAARSTSIVAGSKDAIVMVEAGAKEVPEEQMVQALERAHAAIKEIVAGIDALAAQAGKTKRAAPAQKEFAQDLVRRGRGQGPRTAGRRDADQGQARELRAPSTRSLKDFVAGLSRRRRRAEGRREDDRQGAQGKDPARRDPRARPAARRPQVRRDPARSRSKSASCRAPTAPASSPAARPRRSSPPRSAPPTTSRRSRPSTARPGSASCSTTTSRRSRSAK